MTNLLLTGLGVSEELQAYLNISEIIFDYGSDRESYGKDFHFVPTTRNLWIAGNETAAELVITHSVMEAIAYLSLNAFRYPALSTIRLIAIGNLPHISQMEWIRESCQKRKITLVFGSDLLGRLADITVAAGIRNKQVRLTWSSGGVVVKANGVTFDANPDKLTLNIFERETAIRTAIRTRKPIRFNTFLDQLKYEQSQ